MRTNAWVLALMAGLAAQPAHSQLAERLRGHSLDIEVNAQSIVQSDGGSVSDEVNTRTMKLYISEKGRLFDFSGASGARTLTGSMIGKSSGARVVEWGQIWVQGSVGQKWSTSGSTLIRERIYPWGRQYINIIISADRKNCSASTYLKSSRSDKKFFLYRFSDSRPIEVIHYNMKSYRCSIMLGNIFTSVDI